MRMFIQLYLLPTIKNYDRKLRQESELSGDFLNYLDSLWIIRTVFRLPRQSLESLLIFRTVPRLSGQSLDCPHSF